MENNNVKKEDDSTSFMPSKPLNDSVANDSGANDSGANDANLSSPSQENIESTPSETSMMATIPPEDSTMEDSTMAASTMSSPSMQYSDQSENMPNVSLPGSSGQQTMLTSTGDLVSGECYRYLGNVKNVDGQLAPIFSEDCGVKQWRTKWRTQSKEKKKKT